MQRADGAVAIVPPFEVWEPINTLRREHDKAVDRWDPHTNLFFPCAVYGDTRRLEEALARVRPFRVRLERFYRTPGSKYLEVGYAETASLLALREVVRVALKLPVDAAAYEPHMTVGQCDQTRADALLAEMQAAWEPLEWDVVDVCLLHKDKKGRYVVLKQLPLGGAPAQ